MSYEGLITKYMKNFYNSTPKYQQQQQKRLKNGQRTWTFLQRRYTNGQQIYKKLNHQRHENQNHYKVTPHIP